MAFADTQKLVVELDLKGNLQSGLAAATRSVKGFDKATSNTQRSLSKFGSNIGKTIAIGTAAVAAGGIAVINAASDYESAFAGVRKTVDATDKQLEQLSDQFRDLAKTIPVSAAELARLGEAGGALGISIESMEEFVRVTALLGVTTDLTADDAATSLGILTNVLHLTEKEYSQFASALVALGNAGASTESQIIAIAERAGAAGELVGLTSEQVLALSSSVASLGIEAEAGGSALQKFFIDSAKQIANGGDELALFAKVAGTSGKTFKKAFEKDAGGALTRFLAGLGKLKQADQLAVLEDLGFNDVRITRTLLGLANNTELVGSQMEIANDAFRENTALTKEAGERFKTFDSQLQITKNILTDVAITIGSKLLPKLVPLLQRFNDFVNENQGQIEKFGDDLATAFSDVADAVSRVDWQPFIDGLKFTADVGRTAIGIFQSMPDWLQKLIVAGFAVNKFTGGLVTSLGKDLAGALGAQFLSRGSSPANPLWVTSVGGIGGPGVGGPGGGGGVLGKVGALAAAAALPVAIVSIAEPIKNQLFPNLLGPDKFLPPAPPGGAKPFWELIGQGGGSVRVPENPRLLEKTGALLRSSERHEAIARDAAAKVAAQLAAGDTRTELALSSATTRQVAATGLVKAATDRAVAAANATAAAARHAGQQTAAAIRDKDLSVKVTVPVSIRNYNAVTKQVNSLYKVAS